eukprot:2371963-Pyramimonas_sp.AAC.1
MPSLFATVRTFRFLLDLARPATPICARSAAIQGSNVRAQRVGRAKLRPHSRFPGVGVKRHPSITLPAY